MPTSPTRPIWAHEPPKRGIIITILACAALFGFMFRSEFFYPDYCAALWIHWIGLMSGAVSVFLSIFEKLRNTVGKYTFVAVAVMCVFISAFQAWQDEHKKLLTEENKHKPNLELSYFAIYTAPDPSDPNATIILMTANATNSGEMPSVVLSWSLSINFPDGTSTSTTPLLFPPQYSKATPVNKNAPGSPSTTLDIVHDYLPDVTAKNPIPSGGGQPGFIMFKAPAQASRFVPPGVEYTWCAEDVIHQKPCKTFLAPPNSNFPRVQAFPGMHRDESGKP